MKISLNESNRCRLMRAGIWLPVLLTPVAYMVLAYISDGGPDRSGWWHFMRFIIPFVVLFCVHHFLLVKGLFMRGRYKTYFFSAVVLLAAFVAFSSIRHSGGRHDSGPPPHPAGITAGHRQAPPLPATPHRKDGPVPPALDFCIAVLLIGTNLSVAFFLKYVNEKERNDNLERSRLQQELEYLKAQLNPHFFMNMLNNIHGMVEISPGLAQEMILELSKLMRYVLYEGNRPLIPLQTETEFIHAYIALMGKRYSPRKVSVRLSLPDASAAEGIMLPPLLFIVLIENAFKHGISYLRHSEFDISMSVDERLIRFECRNSRSADTRSDSRYSGIGLANLRKRLSLLFDDSHTLHINDTDETTYTAILTIPYEKNTLHSD